MDSWDKVLLSSLAVLAAMFPVVAGVRLALRPQVRLPWVMLVTALIGTTVALLGIANMKSYSTGTPFSALRPYSPLLVSYSIGASALGLGLVVGTAVRRVGVAQIVALAPAVGATCVFWASTWSAENLNLVLPPPPALTDQSLVDHFEMHREAFLAFDDPDSNVTSATISIDSRDGRISGGSMSGGSTLSADGILGRRPYYDFLERVELLYAFRGSGGEWLTPFWTTGTSLGGVSKGFVYLRNPPDVRFADLDRGIEGYRQIEGNWYLYYRRISGSEYASIERASRPRATASTTSGS